MSNSSINIKRGNVSGNNLGTGGYGIFGSVNPSNVLNFKRLDITGGSIQLFEDVDKIYISGKSGTGEVNAAINLGSGEDLYAGKSGSNLQFKSLIEGDNVSLISSPTEIIISLTGLSQNDGVVSGGTLLGSELILKRSEGLSDVLIDLSGLTGSSVSPGGNNTYVQFNDNGSFGGHCKFTFDKTTCSLTVGDRNFGLGFACGIRSMSVGFQNIASGLNSMAIGSNSGARGTNSFVMGGLNIAYAPYSIAMGLQSCASGASSIAVGISSKAISQGSVAFGRSCADGFYGTSFGRYTRAGCYATTMGSNTEATGNNSIAVGCSTCACGSYSIAMGKNVVANAIGSIAIGSANQSTNKLFSCGSFAINFSRNTNSQTVGYGANAFGSAIVGGQDHNISINNVRAAIVGGDGINLTGNTYVDTTAVANLAIFNTPAAGESEDVLTWNSSTKKVNKVTQGSISDIRLKDNIKPLKNSLDKIIQLNGYEYEFSNLIEPKNLMGNKKYGLLAQETEKLFPLVVKDNFVINNTVYKTIEYKELIPVLVDAIKELNEKYNTLIQNNI